MPRWSRRVVALLALGSGCSGLVACASGPARSPERFCQRLGESIATVTAAVQSPAESSTAIGRFRSIGAAAPEAIRDEWDVLVQLLATADDPATSDSVLAERALASQRAVKAIDDYAKGTCGLDLLHPTQPTQAPTVTQPLTTAAAHQGTTILPASSTTIGGG